MPTLSQPCSTDLRSGSHILWFSFYGSGSAFCVFSKWLLFLHSTPLKCFPRFHSQETVLTLLCLGDFYSQSQLFTCQLPTKETKPVSSTASPLVSNLCYPQLTVVPLPQSHSNSGCPIRTQAVQVNFSSSSLE